MNPPNTLYHHTLNLASPPLAAGLAALHLTAKMADVIGSGGVHSDRIAKPDIASGSLVCDLLDGTT